MVQDIFEDYSSNRAKRGTAKHGTIFSEVGLRKFVFTSELFVPWPYFKCHLTAKRAAEILWLPLQFFFWRRGSKSELKAKKLNYRHLLSNLAKEGFRKRFFNLSRFYVGIKFCVKVNSSLARSLQLQVGNRAQI